MGRFGHKDQRAAMFGHARNDWRTPEDVYRDLSAEFGGFNHDPCPPNYSVDGLFSDWGERNFVNPPYGKDIKRWLNKAYHEAMNGRLVVVLVPSRTDASWWHDYVMNADEVRFIRGRLHFDGAKHSAPFPSAVVIFKPRGSDGLAGSVIPANPRGVLPGGHAAAKVAEGASDVRAVEAVGKGATQVPSMERRAVSGARASW